MAVPPFHGVESIWQVFGQLGSTRGSGCIMLDLSATCNQVLAIFLVTDLGIMRFMRDFEGAFPLWGQFESLVLQGERYQDEIKGL